MSKYICKVCGYVYDEEKGLPEIGIQSGTTWEDVHHDFVCPLCKASKDNFKKDSKTTDEVVVVKPISISEDLKEFTPLEMSALCSNLAKGCGKQFLLQEQEDFEKLANFFKSAMPSVENQDMESLLKLINRDLEELIPYANQTAMENKDRGAMRTLVWNEKVTQMLKSILMRYKSEGDKMLVNTGVYVCTICGFIYIGEVLPEVCPVCKVPNFKFTKIESEG